MLYRDFQATFGITENDALLHANNIKDCIEAMTGRVTSYAAFQEGERLMEMLASDKIKTIAALALVFDKLDGSN